VTLDDDGIATRTYEDIHAEGVVVPSGPLGVVRAPDQERQGDGITVYTVTPISTGNAAENQPADDIIWHDLLWRVTGQDGYEDFNFNVAMADLVDRGGRPFGFETTRPAPREPEPPPVRPSPPHRPVPGASVGRPLAVIQGGRP